MRKVPVTKQAGLLVRGNKSLRSILNKYSISSVRRDRIMQALERAVDKTNFEEHYLQVRKIIARSAGLNLDRIVKELSVLLDSASTCEPLLTAKNKKLCKDIIGLAVSSIELRRGIGKIEKVFAEKRTVINAKRFKILTVLIKRLVNELDPAFRILMRDVHREGKTFRAAANILNTVYPHLNFTPEQVKARYYK